MGTFLAVQRLKRHASTAGGSGSISGQETKIPHDTVARPKKKIQREAVSLATPLSTIRMRSVSLQMILL